MFSKWTKDNRKKRRHRIARDDQRDAFERDRDRILYSSAFRRLSGVTQIVRTGEADVFHTRLTHTLKVAQLGRRLAQNVVKKQASYAETFGVEPEVVEGACLAHDLGHPPFGHLGEAVLNELVEKNGDPDGYEGNAQSFRILTKLAQRFEECDGLDLTRATLASVVKYPWMRDPSDPKKKKKWGAYKSEVEDFDFATDGWPKEVKTAEAEIMDWADDVAYSVHDLEDFHRCNLIPWHRIFDDREALVGNALANWFSAPTDGAGRLREAFDRVAGLFRGLVPEMIGEPYEGLKEQRRRIRTITSSLIGRYVEAISLEDPSKLLDGHSCVHISHDESDEVKILKQITRDYVIKNPALAAQQHGQRRILDELFTDLFEEIGRAIPTFLPLKFLDLHEAVQSGKLTAPRAVADCLASLTEAEVIALHGRLRGYASGSVLDPIVR